MEVGVSLPYLRIGSGGPLVRSIQEQLQRDGYLSGSLDGIFGRQTEQALRVFQQRRGLDADGIVGPDTWRALAEAGLDLASLEPPRPRRARPPRPFIRMGSVGPHVGAIQVHLGLKNTAVFDVATEEAVRKFQVQAGLADDGIVGQKTWTALISSGLNTRGLPSFGHDEALDMSNAVRRAQGQRSAQKLTAYDVVMDLVKTHPEYADGRAGSFDVGAAPSDAQRLLFIEWLARVRPLFDPTLVARLTTRTVVWGLALLDSRLRERLERDGFLTAFRAYRTEEILSPEGRALLTQTNVQPGTAITSDAWTASDDLEYELYAETIAAFIVDGRTRAPLTIGIKAPWGGGKTSLMKMIQRRLDPAAEPISLKVEEDASGNVRPSKPGGLGRTDEAHLKVKQLLSETRGRTPEQAAQQLEPEDPIGGARRTTVWFNAWKYQSSEQLWAGLAHAIVSQLERRMTVIERERFWASLHVRRLHPGAIRRGIYRTLLTRLLPWALAAAVGGLVAAAGAVIPGITVSGIALVGAIGRWLGFLREDVAATSPELVRDPGYEGKLGFLHLVDEDMKRILALARATPESPLVIFVDDLDRCSYTTVAQVIEALNVFLAGDFDNCIFVIGMEPDLVAAQIHVAYEKLFDRLGEERSGDLGWRFLEKMVQLPVALPPPSRGGVDRYVDSILGAAAEAKIEFEAVDLNDDAEEVKEIEELFNNERVTTAADVRPALDRVRERAAQAAPLTPRRQAAIRKVGRKEFAQRLTEQNPEVRRMLRRLAGELPPNPREIKRFINVFRFYAYIQYWREDAGLPAPTLDGVAKLALLAVRYPHLLSALGKDVVQDGDRRCLLSWLEPAQDEADWIKRTDVVPEHLRTEMQTATLRELVTREPLVGPVASGFL
jgi:hypothetical protein